MDERMDKDCGLAAYRECFDEPVPFCIIDVERGESGQRSACTYVYANRALATLENMHIEDLQGKSFESVFAEVEERWYPFFENVAFEGANDRIRWYNARVGRYLDINCYRIAPGRCGCMLTDVTENQRLEEGGE